MQKSEVLPRFYTLGHQSHSFLTMVKLLTSNRVSMIVDVRQNPVSRKTGFSKRQLEEAVPNFGISYAHWPELGTPPSIRKIYLATGNVEKALFRYEQHLRARRRTLRAFIQTVKSERFCLLCLEADHRSCHRSIIAQVLNEMTGCRPIHLH